MSDLRNVAGVRLEGRAACDQCHASSVTIRCRAGCGRYLKCKCLCAAPPAERRYCGECMPPRDGKRASRPRASTPSSGSARCSASRASASAGSKSARS